MARALMTLSVLLAFVVAMTANADETIKLRNSFENDIVFRVKPESASDWKRIKIADGKTGELKVDFAGRCAIRIEVVNEKEKGENREFPIGSFDLKKIISDNAVKELQIHVDVVDAKVLAQEIMMQTKSSSTAAGKKKKKMVPVTKYREETRTRMVTVTQADGTTMTVPQTYTVKVPYTEMVEQEVDEGTTDGRKKELVPVTKYREVTRTYMVAVTQADGTVVIEPRTITEKTPYTVMVEKEVNTDSDVSNVSESSNAVVEFVEETRTRTVPITKTRGVKRTRIVEVVDEKTGEKKTVQKEYVVNVPYTEMVTQQYIVKVPKARARATSADGRQKTQKNDAGLVIRPIVTFEKNSKTVRLQASTKKPANK